MKFKREVVFRPAYDKRDEGCGVHGAEAVFVLRGPKGVVEFELYTNWMLPHVGGELRKPDPAYLRYHSRKPLGSDLVSDSCEYLGGKPCYWGSTALGSELFFDALVEKGSEGVWEKLEEYYREVFGG